VNERICRTIYEAALSESDPEKLIDRLREAEEAIFLRMQTLPDAPDTEVERADIKRATAAILRLQVEKLHFASFPAAN
jgi:hypothetical protein